MKLKQLSPLLFFLPLLCWGISCKSNDQEDTTTNQALVSNCVVELTYDAETTTMMEAANPQEAAQLTELDKALMLPKNDRKLESICLKEDGKYLITSEYLTPTHPIQYPVGTIGEPFKPRYKKVINNNGDLTFLNALGETIYNDGTFTTPTTEVLSVIELFQTLKTQPAVTDADFSNTISVLAANGLNTTQFPNGIVAARTNHTDNSYSIAIIDKNAHMQTGQLNFDANGVLQHLFMIKLSGVAPQVVFERMVQVDFINAFESGVRLKRTQLTNYQTFNLLF